MSAAEFEIIRRYFQRQQTTRNDVIDGIGDDAAVLQVPEGQALVVCMDTLVAGVHFPAETAASAIGHKSLAVNLSDLAAMGAEPLWATLAITLPDNNPLWLEQFSQGFFQLADRYAVQLVGGDTTQGPLSVTVQAHGVVPGDKVIRRNGAQSGDRIYVTGTLGDAGLALRAAGQVSSALQQRLDFPLPQLEAGLLLRDYASAAIDVSDGLLADLEHLLEGERLGASINIDDVPRSSAFLEYFETQQADHPTWLRELPLLAGDDYELCFTVHAKDCAKMEQALSDISIPVTAIGIIEAEPGIRCVDASGRLYPVTKVGYEHFSN